jgi:hypothetical protein
MKTNSLTNLITFLFLTCWSSAKASVVIIDDFSTSPYSIGTSMLSSDISPITSPIADSRWVNGNGTQVWSSLVNAGTGTLNYSVSGIPSPGQRLGIVYSRDSGLLNLTGFSHFVVSVQSLAGSADLYVLYRGSSSQILPEMPITISSSGDYFIPFSHMGVSDPFSPSSVHFRIFPTSDDFSITLSSIGVIPEPTSALMIALGTFAMTLMRRRKS